MTCLKNDTEVNKSVTYGPTVEVLAPAIIVIGLVIIAAIVYIGIHLTSRKKEERRNRSRK